MAQSSGGPIPHVASNPLPFPADTIPQEQLSVIIQALEVVHNPRSSPDARRQANRFLEKVQQFQDAPVYGMKFAADPSQSAVVRHYGLSLIEEFLKRSRQQSSTADLSTIRSCIVQVAEDIVENDPPYLRNKIAKIWVDCAKLQWAKDWMDMDERLCRLWFKLLVHKELVAVILEGLSEDVFRREDIAAGMRGLVLTRACTEIFKPASVGPSHYASRMQTVQLRYGDEGWLKRFTVFLDWALPEHVVASEQCRSCALKTYAALKSAMTWINPKAISAAHCIETMSKGLLVSNYKIQMASVESLLAVYSRSNLKPEDFLSLVCPMFRPDCVRLLQELYQWSSVDPSDIDEDKYALAKKLSEMASVIGNAAEERFDSLPEDSDLHDFLRLLIDMLSSPSLTLSMSVLSTWTRIIRSDTIGNSAAVSSLIGSLMDICSRRLMRYEVLPADSDDPTVLFLNEDMDTMPERHAFIGNYRRYCMLVVEAIVIKQPTQALRHILTQADQSVKSLYEGRSAFQVASYTKNSMTYLHVDAQLTVVESALRGYMKWLASPESTPTGDMQDRNFLEDSLEGWCEQLLNMTFEDPLIKKRILQVAVELATSALKKENFTLTVLKHIFTTQPVDNPNYTSYSEAVKELQVSCTYELHRLAMKMPDFLTTLYDDLEAKITEIVSTYPLDARQKISFQTFLFIIMHRSSTIKDDLRASRLIPIVKSFEESWLDQEFNTSLDTFQGFLKLVGVEQAQLYFLSRHAHQNKDWSSWILDDEGKAVQAQLHAKFDVLPLRATKSFLSVSVEKVPKDSNEHKFAAALWQSAIPLILPRLLKLLGYSHAYYHTQKWAGDSPELMEVANRMLHDRFWQAGISSGTRDDFYAKVSESKASLEGLASTARGIIRGIREQCYTAIYCMSSLGHQIYYYDELPGPLAEALFADVRALTPHQFSTMISMLRYLVDNCPSSRRQVFLTPILSNLFIHVDAKLTEEWSKVARRTEASSEDDDLTEEMKSESILRQFTYSCVMLVAGLLDPQRGNASEGRLTEEGVDPGAPEGNFDENMDDIGPGNTHSAPESLRTFILSSLDIIQPLLSFCTHIIQTPDTRSSIIILRVLKSISRDVNTSQTEIGAATREYLCTEVLRATISSFHDQRFIDVQRDLVTLIVTLYLLYSAQSPSPRAILLSLPGVTDAKLADVHKAIFAATAVRQSRALMSNLLEGVRGMSISEQGQISSSKPPPLDADDLHTEADQQRRRKNKGKAKMMSSSSVVDEGGTATGAGAGAEQEKTSSKSRRKSLDLTGMADLF